MGCNAWNHSPDCDCDCGWGGTFHGHSAGLSQALAWPLASGGWVNPNARCPVCNAAVFFYKSPSGGRVYFDALGAPWPKHPCVSGASEVPDSTYWRAREYFLTWRRNLLARAGISALCLPDKKFARWFVENGFLRGIRNNKYPPTVALWVLQLPYAVLGDVDGEFHRIKKPTVVAMAQRIRSHFKVVTPRGLDQKVCLETAEAVLSMYATPDGSAKNTPVVML